MGPAFPPLPRLLCLNLQVFAFEMSKSWGERFDEYELLSGDNYYIRLQDLEEVRAHTECAINRGAIKERDRLVKINPSHLSLH